MHDAPSCSLRPWLAVYAVVAVWLTFSNLLTLHTADSLIYSLGSLDHWTPFFWEQDRVGMLIPLATMPLRNPLWNLLAQTCFMTFAGLALPLLLMRLLTPTPAGAMAAMIGNVWFLLAAPDLLHENQFIVCMYPAGLCLGVASLIVLETPRSRIGLLTALMLMTLGMWTYLAIVVVILPLAVLRWWTTRRLAGMLITVSGFAIGFGLMKFANNLPPFDVPTSNATLPWREWPASCTQFPFRIREQAGGEFWLDGCLWMLIPGVILAGILGRWDRPFVMAVLTLMLIAAGELCFCGTRKWVANNMHHPRYIIVAITAIPLATAFLGTIHFNGVLTKLPRWLLPTASLLLLLIAASWRHGTPIETRPRAILDQRFGQYSEAIIESECTALGANYWNLWTSYYHLRMTQYDAGGPVPVPVGWRSWEYRSEWPRLANDGPFRVAVPKGGRGELTVETLRRGLEPLTKIGETAELEIYVTQPQRR